MICKNCKQPLTEIEFNNHYRLVCDNDRCNLFREGQGFRAKNPEQISTRTNTINRLYRSSYSAYLEERNQNYHLLRSLGVPSREAMSMMSRKQTRIYLEQNGHGI